MTCSTTKCICYLCLSYLKGLIPVFNGCVDDFLNNLRPLAENKTPVPMKVEFSTLTLSVVTKVHTLLCAFHI